MSLWVREVEANKIEVGYKLNDILYTGHSEFQSVQVVQTEAYGRMLLLDDLVMLTEQDEFVYHEMIAHIPSLMHPNPKNVVVIGGGDGGTVRELLKHSGIEKITLCEIDGLVIDVSKKYFPGVAGKLDDPRVEVIVGDGIDYVKRLPANSLDVLIVDSSDPIGPGEGLFTGEFYRNAAAALNENGLIAIQSESPWHPAEFVNRISTNMKQGFANVRPYVGPVPTYPRGLWSWTLASNQTLDQLPDVSRFRKFENDTRYLTADLLSAVFALPKFYLEKLNG